MRVLIVDDEQLVCDGMCAILGSVKDAELEVKAAGSVARAKELIRDFPPDLVVSDIEMPGANGLEFVEHVKEHYPHTRILVLSGHDDFRYVHTAFMLHVDDYLLKPVDIVKFKDMVRRFYLDLEGGKRAEEIEAVYRSYFPEAEQEGLSPKLREMMDYIRKNFSRDISLKKLADVFGCSETFICNLFRQETGKTFLEFVNQVRLRYAFRALISDAHRSVHRIALDLGYSSERQFFRVFKSKTGVTPTQLRESCAKLRNSGETSGPHEITEDGRPAEGGCGHGKDGVVWQKK